MPRLHWSSILQLARKASSSPSAKRLGPTSFEWDQAGDCQRPIIQEMWGRQSSDDPELTRRQNARARSDWAAKEAAKIFVDDHEWTPAPRPNLHGHKYTAVGVPGGARPVLVVTLHVRCRQCPRCRKVRSRMWYARAITETMQANRTWFGTITLHPDAAHQTLARARQRATRRGLIWEEMTPQEQFTAMHRENGLHLQLWLKRVRKESGARIRFLLVCEAHKSGLPHYHCLVHEMDEAAPVRHSVLSGQWKLGFTNFKLVQDAKQAGYLCKYLSKSALARVRASARYGQTLCSDSEQSSREKLQPRAKHADKHDTPRHPSASARPEAMGANQKDEQNGLPSCEE